MNSCIQTLKKATEDAISAESADELRGIEGCAATAYFECLDQLILKDKDNFFIRGRNRRPPRDRFNALISFLYALLANDIASALESVGIDPYVGFMHTDRPGRASLALDMMEEFRPAADRVALRLINLGLLDKNGFIEKEGGAVLLDDGGRKSVLEEWQECKKGNVRHPFLNENVPMGIVPFVQASLLARSIRGEIDGYPPFILVQ
nr:CRISPR-associated endonuclease Cas1 [Candidatus Methanomethylophilus sp. 1R26]